MNDHFTGTHRVDRHVTALDWNAFIGQTHCTIIISQFPTSSMGSKVRIITFIALPIDASVIT